MVGVRIMVARMTIIAAVILPLNIGCQEKSKFSGGDKSLAPSKLPPGESVDTSTAAPPPGNTVGDSSLGCDEQGNAVFTYSNPAAQACNDQGQIWDFYAGTCTPAISAESFECSFQGILDQMTKLNIGHTQKLLDARDGVVDAGRILKLISCGEKDQGQTIVAQWVRIPASGAGTCSPSPAENVTTGCYRYGGEQISNTATQEEQKAFISRCLSQ